MKGRKGEGGRDEGEEREGREEGVCVLVCE